MTPARKAALLRLLEDWEAGRLTWVPALFTELPTPTRRCAVNRLRMDHLVLDVSLLPDWCSEHIALTPAGLSAARKAKEEDDAP